MISADPNVMDGAYVGDLDGNLWTVGIDPSGSAPLFAGVPSRIFSGGADQPVFASPALGTSGTGQYLFFATRSDLLPSSRGSNPQLMGLRASGSATPAFAIEIEDDSERVSGQAVVAGDAVFFTTTRYHLGTSCAAPDASVYALTFSGGPAYDTTGDGVADAADDSRVATLANRGRATAPVVGDRHLWFGAGTRVSVLGDEQGFDMEALPPGVRITTWRRIQ
jgi:hypothetical protein